MDKIRKPKGHKKVSLAHNRHLIERMWPFCIRLIDTEIKCRIENIRSTFTKFSKVLTGSFLTSIYVIKFMKCYLWPVLLYEMEGSTLKVDSMNSLEAIEMWAYRRISKASRTKTKLMKKDQYRTCTAKHQQTQKNMVSRTRIKKWKIQIPVKVSNCGYDWVQESTERGCLGLETFASGHD